MAKLDVTDIIEKYSVPTGYILELMVINLVKPKPIVHGSGTGEMLMIEYPIFPKEFIIECSDSEIEKKIEEETSSYQRISESYQAVGFLDQSGLSGIGDDLTKALTRFDKDDYEGSIKFFRKVLDALRYLSENKEITKSKNRNGAIKDFANKAFHLLSNFGEHHGTVGLEEDARLARDITVALATYVSKNFQVNK